MTYFVDKLQWLIIFLGLVLCTPIYKVVRARIEHRVVTEISYYLVLGAFLIFNLGLIAVDTYNPFI